MRDLFYYETGHGLPVVFIHGFCESNSIWKDLSKSLSNEFRIICPDLPGFGKSPLPDHDITLEEIGDELVKWLQDIGVQGCIVIGHSLGGYIALEMMRKHQSFVQAIGLFNSTAFEDPAEKKENRNKLIEFIGEHGVKPFLKTFVPSLFYPETVEKHQKTIDQIRKEGMNIQPESVMKYAAAMRDRKDSMDLLQRCRDEVLLISGEFDQNVPIEASNQMAAVLNPENVHIIHDSAHMSVFEQRELCYEAIRNFARNFVD